MRPRSKTLCYLLAALLLPVAAVVSWLWFGQGPNLVGNRTLALEAYRGDPKAAEELKSRGTRAAPDLGEMLKTNDTPLRHLLWRLQQGLPLNLRRWVLKRGGQPSLVATREAAARGLALLGTNAMPAMPSLGQALYDDLGIVRWESANALVRIGPPSIPLLVEALGSTNYRTRHVAAYALGEMRPPARSAHRALIKAGNDTNHEVRSSALYSLGQVGAPISEPLRLLLNSTNELARIKAREALLGPYGPAGPSFTRMLSNACSGDVEERVLAIRTLAALNARRKDVVERMRAIAADEREDLRIRAVAGEALERANH